MWELGDHFVFLQELMLLELPLNWVGLLFNDRINYSVTFLWKIKFFLKTTNFKKDINFKAPQLLAHVLGTYLLELRNLNIYSFLQFLSAIGS